MNNTSKRTKNRQTGDLGEELAIRYLEDRGFGIKERNYWRPWGEIDVVSQKDGNLFFFEVKAAISSSRETIRPELNLHPGKLKRFNRIVQSYLWERRIPPRIEWSFQAICVLLNMENKKAKVELIKDII